MVQRDACEQHVRTYRDWEILEERYDDHGVSGATLRRPALQRLLHDVDAARVDIVLVSAADRLSRSHVALATLVRRMRAIGAEFASATEGFYPGERSGERWLALVSWFVYLDTLKTAVPAVRTASDDALEPVLADEPEDEP